MRVIFMGTARLACPSLEALCAGSEFEVIAVVTQPDRPRGRDLKVQPSAVKAFVEARLKPALQRPMPVLQPERARNPEFIEELRELAPDVMVVVAYGQILPQTILDVPRHGCVNVHASVLPKYRGAAPIQWAILSDEPETGVTIMKMDAGLDTGPILRVSRTSITPEDNSQTLHDRLANIGAELLVKTLPDYVAGKIQPIPQPTDGTYARKITKEDGQIDWSQPARAIWNRVRALTPWPGTFTSNGGERLKIWKVVVEGQENPSARAGEILQADTGGIVVACGAGAVRILELQREGGRRLQGGDFLRGHPLRAGERLGKSG